MAKLTGTKADLIALATLINSGEERPKMGVKIGGGIHVAIPEAYTPGAPGWLQTVADLSGELNFDPGRLVKLTAGGSLTPEQKTLLTTLLSRVTEVST